MFRWITTPLCHSLTECSASILTQAGGPGSQGTAGGRRVPTTCMACKSRLLHIYCRGPVSISRPSFQVWYFHYKDKLVMRPSCFYNGNPYPGKTASLYWDGSHVAGCSTVREIWDMASNWLVWPVVWLAASNIYWGTPHMQCIRGKLLRHYGLMWPMNTSTCFFKGHEQSPYTVLTAGWAMRLRVLSYLARAEDDENIYRMKWAAVFYHGHWPEDDCPSTNINSVNYHYSLHHNL